MRKVVVLLIAVWLATLTSAFAQNFKGKAQKGITIESPQKSLEAGERLEYSVEWLGIPIARLLLHTQGVVQVNNRKCYHMHGQTSPNKFFRRIYDAQYSIDTYLDVQTLQPVRFEKARRVKGVLTCVVLEFDQENHLAKYSYFTPQGSAQVYNFFAKTHESAATYSSTVSAPAGSQDIFSSLYYFRLLDVAPGKIYPITICYSDKTWNMDVRVSEPLWKEMRKKGTVPVFTANISSDLNYSILGKRKFSVIFTADAKRIPLEFSLGTMVGELRAVLQNL